SFDSTGLGTLQRSVVIQATNDTQLSVHTPSLATIWKQLCNGVKTSGLDSGIAWGTVRDAATGIRQSGAAVGFTWYDASVAKNKKMLVQEVARDVRTDSTGVYYACGLPTEIRVSSEATGTRSASGVIEYLIGARRMMRIDLLVSTDMVLQPIDRERTPAESIAALKPHGRATLRGVIRDTKGVLVPNAMITLASLDTMVRSDERGEFRLSSLPAGTHVLQARSVGFTPASMLIDLVPDSTTAAVLLVAKANELAVVNVRAERVAGRDKVGYDERRREGWGYALEHKDFKNRPDVASILQQTPGLNLKRVRPGEFIVQTMAPCTVVYVDGGRTSIDALAAYQPDDLRAIEVYPRYVSSPPMYAVIQMGSGCGTILFWTKSAKW
ncbi:MAG: carboxypeptidase-like regulatory domain-containing protein, partial [Gemmatimonadaceae bacterium]